MWRSWKAVESLHAQKLDLHIVGTSEMILRRASTTSRRASDQAPSQLESPITRAPQHIYLSPRFRSATCPFALRTEKEGNHNEHRTHL
jgi:hypothetical protein